MKEAGLQLVYHARRLNMSDKMSILIIEDDQKILNFLSLGLKAKGYEIVPISKLIYKDNYHLDVTGRQIQD